jgi:hypothetical protein
MMHHQLSQCGVSFQLASPPEVKDRSVLQFFGLEDPAGVPIDAIGGGTNMASFVRPSIQEI